MSFIKNHSYNTSLLWNVRIGGGNRLRRKRRRRRCRRFEGVRHNLVPGNQLHVSRIDSWCDLRWHMGRHHRLCERVHHRISRRRRNGRHGRRRDERGGWEFRELVARSFSVRSVSIIPRSIRLVVKLLVWVRCSGGSPGRRTRASRGPSLRTRRVGRRAERPHPARRVRYPSWD